MTCLSVFIGQCEKDLVNHRVLSDDTLLLFQRLSDNDKILCKPVIDFITIRAVSKEINMPPDIVFTPQQRLSVCRLIPLLFALDTDEPAWSSYMLSNAINCLSLINGMYLSEIGIAFLEVCCKYSSPLNKYVYNFCIDLSREFTIQHRKRLSEFVSLESWGDAQCRQLPSVAFLKYVLVPIDNYTPKFILQTIIPLLRNECFEEFMMSIKCLFEDSAYKRDFLQYLEKSELSGHDKDLISKVV